MDNYSFVVFILKSEALIDRLSFRIFRRGNAVIGCGGAAFEGYRKIIS